MTSAYSKIDVTTAVLSQLSLNGSELVDTLDACMSKWWVTRRSASGFQLSGAGQSAFDAAEIDWEERILDTTGRGTVWLIERQLNRALPCPFWVEHNARALTYRHAVVRMYDTRLVCWIDLGGDLAEYLRKYEERIRK